MKRSFFPIILVLCFFVSFISCSNSSDKRPRKPVNSVVIKPVKEWYTCGEKVSVKINTKLRDGKLASTKVYYHDQLIKETDELEFIIDDLELTQLGNSTLKVVSEKTDGLNNTKIKAFNVRSDIRPKQYTYQVINNYPHLTTSYTQGLEYLNGFLYEGTGQTEKSKLYKIDIKRGKPLLTFDMDDKYFGEGITILNDKIYQLTYHAQKGFIYDLHTFAVLDSFIYKSFTNEGWGLTNDGTNLIMSDGSNILTWLNPKDFSVIKTLQVANNKGNMGVLNELEYINGYIYANIYTTDYIVKIDIESGKVLEEINMAGIIDIYNTPKDVDHVLNGIAYDKENDRMFVTGKLWPKLFEVKFIEKK